MISTKLRDLEQMVTDRTFWLDAGEKARQEHWKAKTAIANLEAELQNAKYGFEFDVRTAMDDKGKPLFGNEKLRDVEVSLRMAKDETCQQVRKELAEWRDVENRAYRSVMQAKDEVRNLRDDQFTSTVILAASMNSIGQELLDVGQSVG